MKGLGWNRDSSLSTDDDDERPEEDDSVSESGQRVTGQRRASELLHRHSNLKASSSCSSKHLTERSYSLETSDPAASSPSCEFSRRI